MVLVDYTDDQFKTALYAETTLKRTTAAPNPSKKMLRGISDGIMDEIWLSGVLKKAGPE